MITFDYAAHREKITNNVELAALMKGCARSVGMPHLTAIKSIGIVYRVSPEDLNLNWNWSIFDRRFHDAFPL